jgi:hypothetical protein
LLGDPSPDRVSAHASQEDLATLEVDEKQYVNWRWSVTVPTWKKSHARVLAACARKNSDHEGPDVRGAG